MLTFQSFPTSTPTWHPPAQLPRLSALLSATRLVLLEVFRALVPRSPARQQVAQRPLSLQPNLSLLALATVSSKTVLLEMLGLCLRLLHLSRGSNKLVCIQHQDLW